VLADMPSTSSMLVMSIIIELIVCKWVLVSYKSNIIRYMLLLGEVFDIKTQINDCFLVLNRVSKLNQEAARNFIDHSSRQLKDLLYLSVWIVSLCR
jgi:hypothetical protein